MQPLSREVDAQRTGTRKRRMRDLAAVSWAITVQYLASRPAAGDRRQATELARNSRAAVEASQPHRQTPTLSDRAEAVGGLAILDRPFQATSEMGGGRAPVDLAHLPPAPHLPTTSILCMYVRGTTQDAARRPASTCLLLVSPTRGPPMIRGAVSVCRWPPAATRAG